MHTLAVYRAPFVPNTGAGAHPFEAARIALAALSRGVLVREVTAEEKRERRDARMRMDSKACHPVRDDIEVVQEHERLDEISEVVWIEQTSDRSLRHTARATHDRAQGKRASLWVRTSACGEEHGTRKLDFRFPHRFGPHQRCLALRSSKPQISMTCLRRI